MHYLIAPVIALVSIAMLSLASAPQPFIGAPSESFTRSMLPITDSVYDVGTTSRAYSQGWFDEICLTGDTCHSSIGGGGTFAWTPTDYGVSTSTTLGFLSGFLSTASSTHTGVLHVDGTLDFQNDFVFDSAEEGGIQRLRLQAAGANDAAELFLQAKGNADASRITVTPDSSNANYSFLTFESNGTEQLINSGSEGTESTLPFGIQIDGTDAISVDTSRRVGIGTTTPTTNLHVYDTAVSGALNNLITHEWISSSPADMDTSDWLSLFMANSNGERFEYAKIQNVVQDVTAGTEDGALKFFSARNGTLEEVATFDQDEIILNDSQSDRNFIVKDTNGDVFTIRGNTGRVGVSDATPDFQFETTGSSGSGYFGITNSTDGDILTVNGSGQVGIGTIDPSTVLDVQGTASSTDVRVDSLTGNRLVLSNSAKNLISSVATSTPTIGSGLSYSGTFGDLIGGADGTLTVDEANVDHDSLQNFVANEHIDWTSDQGATNIDAGNITGLTLGTEVTGSIEDLSDVNSMTPGASDVLAYNGGWVNMSTSTYILAGENISQLNNDSGYITSADDSVEASELTLDYGDFTCNGTTCTLDTGTVSDNEIDYTNVTLADFDIDDFAGDTNNDDDLDVAAGGTGVSTFTSSQLLYGAGANDIQSVATTSATIGDGLSYSGTFGDLVGGVAGTLTADLGTAIDTSEITNGTIIEPDLNADDSANDEDILTYDSTGTNFVWETILDLVNTITGAVDWGGITSFEIPNGASPSVNATGELAVDTTSDFFVVGDSGGTARGIPTEQKIWSVTVASTSPAFIDGSTLAIPVELEGYTMSAIRCKVDGGTSKVIAVEDASANSTEDITCAGSVTSDDGTITNASVTAEEEMYIDFGATTGAVDSVSISTFGHWTID